MDKLSIKTTENYSVFLQRFLAKALVAKMTEKMFLVHLDSSVRLAITRNFQMKVHFNKMLEKFYYLKPTETESDNILHLIRSLFSLTSGTFKPVSLWGLVFFVSLNINVIAPPTA